MCSRFGRQPVSCMRVWTTSNQVTKLSTTREIVNKEQRAGGQVQTWKRKLTPHHVGLYHHPTTNYSGWNTRGKKTRQMQSNLGEDWTRLTTTYLTHVILETIFCLLVWDKDIVIDLFLCWWTIQVQIVSTPAMELEAPLWLLTVLAIMWNFKTDVWMVVSEVRHSVKWLASVSYRRSAG